jgi:hypothetical protein
MRRLVRRALGSVGFLVVLGLITESGVARAATRPDWVAPHTLATQVAHPDITSVNRTFRTNGSGAPIDGPVRRGQIVSVASLDGLHTVAPTLEPGTWVMYDIERWKHTPKAEQAEPFRSMGRFVSAARSYGFVAVLAPAGRDWRERGARREADVFLAQVQKITDPATYRKRLCEIVRRFRGPVYGELSANGRPGHGTPGLVRLWRAGRSCTSKFALWGRDADVIRRFLRRVA